MRARAAPAIRRGPPRKDTATARSNELRELAPYLVAIRTFPLLGREEERALAVASRAGDRAARDRLIRHNLALVVAVARKHRRGGLRLEDLVQEGNLGLMRAVEKFDPRVGTRFSTYATWWIRAYVGRHLEQASAPVRPGAGGRIPYVYSLDAPVGDEEGSATYLDHLEDERPGPEDAVLASAHGRSVRALLARVRGQLGPVAWDIVHNRLARDPPETLAEIGERWGLSRERIRQVELETTRFLRHRLQAVAERDPVRDAA